MQQQQPQRQPRSSQSNTRGDAVFQGVDPGNPYQPAATPPQSLQFPNTGPWGRSVDQQLQQNAQVNAAFSQRAFLNAKQDGCLPAPCMNLPTWPPANSAYRDITPTFDKEPVMTLDLGPRINCNLVPPFSDPTQPDLQYPVPPPPPMAINRAWPTTFHPTGLPGAPTAESQTLGNCPLPRPQQQVRWVLPTPTPTQLPAPSREFSVAAVPFPTAAAAGSVGSAGSAPTRMVCSDRLCSQDPPSAAIGFARLVPCCGNTWKGIVSDLQHWHQLPCADFVDRLAFVFGRERRPMYVFVSLLLLFLLVWGVKRIL